jgi:DNA-binding beta-propeller fold protein YncE
MLTKLAMVLVVLGAVAFAVGTLTVPELGEANPRSKIVAAISVAKAHRDALDNACEANTLEAGLSHAKLGLERAQAYAANFRSRVDVEVESATAAKVTVALKNIAATVPPGSTVSYVGNCDNGNMSWVRTSSLAGWSAQL